MIKLVKVKRGDTLSEIAEREYGNWRRWLDIYFANMPEIRDDPRNRACIRIHGRTPPDWIFPGMFLRVPVKG